MRARDNARTSGGLARGHIVLAGGLSIWTGSVWAIEGLGRGITAIEPVPTASTSGPEEHVRIRRESIVASITICRAERIAGIRKVVVGVIAGTKPAGAIGDL